MVNYLNLKREPTMSVSRSDSKAVFSDDLLESLLANYQKPEDILGENGLIKQLTKAVIDRALKAEMTEHLGYPRNGNATNPEGNRRNGSYNKKLKADFGELSIEVPS